jgi:hypothetical protein
MTISVRVRIRVVAVVSSRTKGIDFFAKFLQDLISVIIEAAVDLVDSLLFDNPELTFCFTNEPGVVRNDDNTAIKCRRTFNITALSRLLSLYCSNFSWHGHNALATRAESTQMGHTKNMKEPISFSRTV